MGFGWPLLEELTVILILPIRMKGVRWVILTTFLPDLLRNLFLLFHLSTILILLFTT